MLKGERVVLRAVEPEDLDLMYLVENDAGLWHCGSSNVPYSSFTLRRFIEETSNDIFRDGQLRLVIEKEDGTSVGFLDLQNFNAMHSRAEVGIVLVPEAQGYGYAKEALMLLCRYAGKHLHLHLLYAVVSEENSRGRKLFLSSGFAQSGVLPQWLRTDIGYSDAILFTLIP